MVCNVDTITIPYPEIQHSEPMPIEWMCEQKLFQGDQIRKNTILQLQAMVGVYKVVVIKFSVETHWPHFKIIYFISHWSLLRLCHIVLRSKYIVYILTILTPCFVVGLFQLNTQIFLPTIDNKTHDKTHKNETPDKMPVSLKYNKFILFYKP